VPDNSNRVAECRRLATEARRILPRPLQQPSPPRWTTVVSAESARRAARRRITGDTVRIEDAIARHKGEADGVTRNFEKLSADEKRDLLLFVGSL
jgi:alkanesulfonate monooxygenase SsuD/methylene tetrahydromethanopterin reductase-like flavin-dependent oxidoreductase (luciferase family)